MHFQDERLYGYNAVTMATSPIFFFTTIHFGVQTYQAIKKIWLCFVLPWGGVTPISRPLLENGRSTNSQVSLKRESALSAVPRCCGLELMLLPSSKYDFTILQRVIMILILLKAIHMLHHKTQKNKYRRIFTSIRYPIIW